VRRGWVALAALTACATDVALPDRARDAWAEARERTGNLMLTCEPADARVQVDGVPRGLCSDFDGRRGLALGKGMHQVDVNKDGYEPYRSYWDPSGAQGSAAVVLRPLPPQGATP